MTPQSPSPFRRFLVRRSAAVVAAALVIGAPLVARALGDGAAPAASLDRGVLAEDVVIDASIDVAPETVAPKTVAAFAPADAMPEPAPDIEPDVDPEPVVDPVIVLLADSYTWGEQGARVALLHDTLGLDADSSYGHTTLQAHHRALEFVGLPTDTLPVPILPPGPSSDEWEALRWCESNGNYAIANPSGKYRGAYQFDRTTWNSVAGRHAPHLVGIDPAAAAPADQDFLALALYSERGARPWPHCGRHLS